MSEEKSLIKINDPKSVAEFLQKPAQFLTGILISENKDWKLSAGKLVQASIRNEFFSQLGKEIEEYTRKGKIKENFLEDKRNFQSLHELLKFIDEAAPEEDHFKAMKSLFFLSVSSDTDAKDKILAYQFMQIAKRTSSGDLLVLKATYEIEPQKGDSLGNNVHHWFDNISRQIGHNIPSLVEFHEKNLMDLKLISERSPNDVHNGFIKTEHYRLTKLGYKFCEFIMQE